MKKIIFILVTILISAFSILKAQDTLSFQTPSGGYPIDTINKTYIYPEVMNPNVCYDQGLNDPIIVYYPRNIESLTCDGKPLKAIAQGFMFNDTMALDGITGWFGIYTGYNLDYNTVNEANFKMGIMDDNYNIIYQKDYLFQVNFPGNFSTFVHIPFDSILHLNDFVYIFIEWPDSACVGGAIHGAAGGVHGIQYSDDNPKLHMTTYTEELFVQDSYGSHYESPSGAMCEACNVKYAPLFKWYGATSWVDLYSLRCGHLNELCYWGIKDGVEQALDSYFTLGMNFYYNNANNNNDSGLSDLDISYLVSLQPNPANEVLKINSSFKIREIEIHNALGQVVLRKEGSQNIETLDVSNLQSGTYIVRIKTQRGFANKKLIIK